MSLLLVDAFSTGRVRSMTGEWHSAQPLPEGTVLFDGQDVVDFAWGHPAALDIGRLTVRPPAESVWVEYTMSHPDEPARIRVGALVRVFDRGMCAGSETSVTIESYFFAPNRPGTGLVRCPWSTMFALNDRGGLVLPDDGGFVGEAAIVHNEAELRAFFAAKPDGDELLEAERRQAFHRAGDILAVFAACHIKNTERAPLVVSRQVRRQRERQGLVDVGEVTVLRIPRSVRDAAGPVASDEERARARHLTLGHLVHYGDTHPDGRARGKLFGKYEGVFWKDAHWRGVGELGERRHTYEVRADELRRDSGL